MIAEDILCLTPDGWKGWRELKAGTEICVFDLRSMCFRSEPVREVRFYPWNGFLLKIGSLLVTPDHPLLLWKNTAGDTFLLVSKLIMPPAEAGQPVPTSH